MPWGFNSSDSLKLYVHVVILSIPKINKAPNPKPIAAGKTFINPSPDLYQFQEIINPKAGSNHYHQ